MMRTNLMHLLTDLGFAHEWYSWLWKLDDGQCDIEDMAEYFEIPLILVKWNAKENNVKYYMRGEGREF